MDRDHEHDPEMLIGWALAVSPEDADRIRTTLNGCASCATGARKLRGVVHLLGTVDPVEPPAELRSKVLARARAALHRTAPVPMQTLAYAGQVAALDALLAELTPADWAARVPGDRDVRGLIAHLSSNDALVTADVREGGAADRGHARDVWRAGATALLAEVRPRGADRLGQPVRLAGRRPTTRPLSDGLVQRAFETWIHADDIRTAVGLPPVPPPAEHLHLIADLGARLLPLALVALGTVRPGRLARLDLTGPGAGGWEVPLATGPVSGDPVAAITMEAIEFCRLLAGRRTPAEVGHDATGDPAVAQMILHAATTLGCE